MAEFIGSRLAKILDLGVGGNVYGGRLLDFMAEMGAIYAAGATGEEHLLGYKFDNVTITRPVKAGEIIDFFASDCEFRNCSVSFGIVLEVKGERVLSGRCVYVAADENGKKKALCRK